MTQNRAPKRVHGNACPVEIRGVRYDSQAEAAEKLCVAPSTVSMMLERGRADYIGLGAASTTRIPVVVDGLSYGSFAAASRAMNRKKTWLAGVVREARLQGKTYLDHPKYGRIEWGKPRKEILP